MSLICKSKQFCFIHIGRTGGTTIKHLLAKQLDDVKTSGKLQTIKECLETNPETINYYKFSFVRQPYDWILSLYYYIKMPSSNHVDFKIVKNLKFYEFLEWVSDVGMKRKEGRLPVYSTQSNCIFINDSLMVDVFKFENICDDMESSNIRTIFNKFELPHLVNIPVLSKSDRPMDYSLSIKEVRLINKLFEADFKNFNYAKYDYHKFF